MRDEDNRDKASNNQPMRSPADNNKSSGSLSWKSPTDSDTAPENTVPAEPSAPAASAHYQRIQDIQAMLKLGAYWVPAQKLAPILAKIFFSMRRSGHFGNPSRPSEPKP